LEVTDKEFSETFVAVARPGYFFRRWRPGERNLCSSSVEKCKIDAGEFKSIESSSESVDLQENFYLTPVFAKGECIDISGEFSPIDFPISRVRKGNACPDRTRELRLHGLLKLWEDGSLVSTTRWDLGKRQGMASIRWPNGKQRATARWQQGRLDGRVKRYYRDGALKSYTSYRAGIRRGPFAVFTRSGDIKTEGRHSPSLRVMDGIVVHDKEQDLVWVRDANLFKTLCTEGSEILLAFQPLDAESPTEICERNGAMTWNDANLWVEHLNQSNYAGYSAWRMPTVNVDSICDGGGCVDHEMGTLYYESLDNLDGQGDDDEAAEHRLWSGRSCNAQCLFNHGPFNNIQTRPYWLGTLHPIFGDYYFFIFSFGDLDSDNPENRFHVWPVSSVSNDG
jgi:hypothetical protein